MTLSLQDTRAATNKNTYINIIVLTKTNKWLYRCSEHGVNKAEPTE